MNRSHLEKLSVNDNRFVKGTKKQIKEIKKRGNKSVSKGVDFFQMKRTDGEKKAFKTGGKKKAFKTGGKKKAFETDGKKKAFKNGGKKKPFETGGKNMSH